MLVKDAVKDFLFECEIKKYTWKTVKGYRNNLNFLCNYLEREHGATDIEKIATPHIKAFLRFQQVKGRKPTYEVTPKS